ncbi:UNVERIFIED_CONTAM: hypothetical protein HDU68_004267 [Siphonaria sp. JEL0065]|nr:hypothetical protein HDU68_004267 [Siphonaria sp. JEL0065]
MTNNLACSYKADFPVGLANTEDLVKAHFDSLGLKYHIRTSINNKFANFVSFTIEDQCDYQSQVATIPQATQFSPVKVVARPEPVKPGLASVHGTTAEL